jgi:AcrR family transcriptional regulator
MAGKATASDAEDRGVGSRRRAELLDLAYRYAHDNGLADMSLRPLAAATATSPRVLLYLFGSKDGLVREILARARHEQRTLVAEVVAGATATGVEAYDDVVAALWGWLSAPQQRPTIRLFFEAYNRALQPDPGPWDGFAEESVGDWVEILVAAQPQVGRRAARTQAVATLAVLRGLLLHLLAGGDARQLTAALLLTTSRGRR